MNESSAEGFKITDSTSSYAEPDPHWECYLFGSGPKFGMSFIPRKGRVPNFFVRWMMRVCLGCTWVKK